MAITSPRLLVACRRFGVSSEVWAYRQISAFDKLSTTMLAWDVAESPSYPGAELVALDVLDQDFDRIESSCCRWLHRMLCLPRQNFLLPTRSEAQKLVRIIRQRRPNVILCHFGHVGLRMLGVAKEFNIPVVCHFHGLDISSGLRNRYYRWSLSHQVTKFAHCIVVGSQQRRTLIELGANPDRISLIPCGAPVREFTPRTEDHEKTCTFLAVSRLVPWKGIMETVKAFAHVAQLTPNVRLEIIGTGPGQDEMLAHIKRLGLGERIQFRGRKTSAEVAAAMRNANVFVQHSLDYHDGWNEGFGVSITEASATGLPVIVTNSGGITDQILDGKNGLVVPQRDIPAYAHAMMQMANSDELRRRLGSCGRAMAVSMFDSFELSKKLQGVLIQNCKSAIK